MTRNVRSPVVFAITCLAMLALALAPGCSKKEAAVKKEDKAEDTKAGPAFARTTGALKSAGFTVSAFEQAAARPYEAQKCSRGEVDKLDVLLCEYGSDAAAESAEKKVLQFFGGAVTGAVRRAGTVVLAVADRKKIDVQGKTINKLLKAFGKQGS